MTNHGPRSRLVFCLLLALSPSASKADDLGAGNWKLKVDPPATPPAAPASKDFAIPYPANFGQGNETVYPSTPSPFVAIGKNAFDNDVRQVWDLSTRKMVGSFKGQLGFDDKTIALSPDGAYLAGKPTFRKTIEVRATEERAGRPDHRHRLAVRRLRRRRGGRPRGDRPPPPEEDGGPRHQDRRQRLRSSPLGRDRSDKDAIGFSPGRAYLAAVSWPQLGR